MISQLRWGPKEASSLVVEDVDWATSDQTVLITSDGVVRIYDISMQLCQCCFTLADFKRQFPSTSSSTQSHFYSNSRPHLLSPFRSTCRQLETEV